MATMAVAFPIVAGKEDLAKEFAAQCSGPRREEMDKALRVWGVRKEHWYVQQSPMGSLLVIDMEANDPVDVFNVFAQANSPFDQWFKGQAQEVTGIDFNTPPAALPEKVFGWEG
jgi:hypothetical protein